MVYTLKNRKNITIPNKEIEKNMEILEISKEEAIKLWLEDNEYEINDEQEKLDTKAKNLKPEHGVDGNNLNKKPQKVREKKPNFEKKAIMSALFKGLTSNLDGIEDISMTNDEKYIDFVLNNINYTVNLVAHRAKK